MIVALSAFTAGCGVGEYEKRLERRAAEVRKSAVFDVLYQATELPDSPILVRVPRAFTQRLAEGAEIEGRRIDAQRVRIPGLELPGPLVTYEATVQDSTGGKQPYYIYLTALPASKSERLRSATLRKFDGAKPAEPTPPNEPVRLDKTGELFERVQKAFPQANAAWQDETCRTPADSTLVWQRLTVSGPQEFFYADNAGQRYVSLPGRLEIWARYFGDYLVLIVWRLPESLLPVSQAGVLSPLVAGSTTSR
jgi:hypothetical protein